jgi:transcriptional regulator with XRE-family HTH domain
MTKETIFIKFGNRVREIRNDAGISQEELAFRATIHRIYLGALKRRMKPIT